MLWFGILMCAGVLILWWGIRGTRYGAGTRCRRCDQIVDGIAANICPECGADLTRRAVVQRVRRRDWPKTTIGFALLFLSTFLFCTQAHDALTRPGWAMQAPGWWLSEVEMRFATDGRLDEVAAGLLNGHATGKISKWSARSGLHRGFDMYLGRLKAGQRPEPVLRVLALQAASEHMVPREQIAEAIELSTVITQWTAESPRTLQTDPGGKVDCAFLPANWELRYSYDIKDVWGSAIGNYFEGQVGEGWRNGRRVPQDLYGDIEKEPNSKRYKPTRIPPSSGPYTCEWRLGIYVVSDKAEAVRLWTKTNPFLLDFDEPRAPESPGRRGGGPLPGPDS